MGRRLLLVTPTLVAVVVISGVALALSACGGQENKKGESGGGSAATNGQIAFRRFFDPDQSKGAIFTVNPDGSHESQITHPPKTAGSTNPQTGLPMDRGSPSTAIHLRK